MLPHQATLPRTGVHAIDFNTPRLSSLGEKNLSMSAPAVATVREDQRSREKWTADDGGPLARGGSAARELCAMLEWLLVGALLALLLSSSAD